MPTNNKLLIIKEKFNLSLLGEEIIKAINLRGHKYSEVPNWFLYGNNKLVHF